MTGSVWEMVQVVSSAKRTKLCRKIFLRDRASLPLRSCHMPLTTWGHTVLWLHMFASAAVQVMRQHIRDCTSASCVSKSNQSTKEPLAAGWMTRGVKEGMSQKLNQPYTERMGPLQRMVCAFVPCTLKRWEHHHCAVYSCHMPKAKIDFEGHLQYRVSRRSEDK